MKSNMMMAINNQPNFMGLIPASEITQIKNGVILYATDKSRIYNPLVIQKRGKKILVATQENYEKNRVKLCLEKVKLGKNAIIHLMKQDLVNF